MRRQHGGVPSAPIVLLALDKFKGRLSAIDVCTELRTGLLNGHQPIEVIVHPVADGGDGTAGGRTGLGLWTQRDDLMPITPQPSAVPALWRWATLYPLAERSGALIPVGRGGER